MSENYIKAQVFYEGVISTISKSSDAQSPLFEAITNSLESIKDYRSKYKIKDLGEIAISVNVVEQLNIDDESLKAYSFSSVTVTDTGIGFNDIEFERVKTLNDNRKGYSNKGSGRVQFLHNFNTTEIESVYNDDSSSTKLSRRKFRLSKSVNFLKNNAIIHVDEESEAEEGSRVETTLTFLIPLDDSIGSFWANLSASDLKKSIIRRYLDKFCEERESLPKIQISRISDKEEIENLEITSDDIPKLDHTTEVTVSYSEIVNSKISKINKLEEFSLKSFKIPKDELAQNEIKLISKGEIAAKLPLEILSSKESVDNYRYLFLLSGDYIDQKDSNTRGDLKILSKDDLKKRGDELSLEPEVLIDDIAEKTNQKILGLYAEITKKLAEKQEDIEELKKMFLLNKRTLHSLSSSIKLNDTDETILSKIYKADAEIEAKKDAKIRKEIKKIESLDPSKKNYQELIEKHANNLTKKIPLQNRTSLTQYVARRKLVLDLFNKVLSMELDKLKNGERIDEKLMHNIIFQQTSDSSETSDLWLIGEDFIYFKGFSESQLCKIKIGDDLLFKSEFSEEEERYLNSLGEKRLDKRPDILLFPEEGKCIIIEFKAPDVNVSDHLSQISKYAGLILNYTQEKFQITTFYGYLIGESIEHRDVRDANSSFHRSYHLDYWFQPSTPVAGYDGRSDGSIYTEVIKYSTLLKRAQLRNKIFIEKLGASENTHIEAQADNEVTDQVEQGIMRAATKL